MPLNCLRDWSWHLDQGTSKNVPEVTGGWQEGSGAKDRGLTGLTNNPTPPKRYTLLCCPRL